MQLKQKTSGTAKRFPINFEKIDSTKIHPIQKQLQDQKKNSLTTLLNTTDQQIAMINPEGELLAIADVESQLQLMKPRIVFSD